MPRKTHGLGGTRIYHIWHSMIQRCHSPISGSYKWYGARGISVCADWRLNFQSFYDWAIANGYKDSLTIDRKDADKGYFPENCHWANWTQQIRSRKTTKPIEFEGVTMLAQEWSAVLGISYGTLYDRLRRGWSVKDSLFKKPDQGSGRRKVCQ